MRSDAGGPPRAGVPAPVKIAILAMGGEGGGVLADWIVELAERNAHVAQVTSVPGVAQRTGATIYYVELFPALPGARSPVLALAPLPGDVDIVLASELMEGARAVQRGLVTPERTTLVMSTHRVYTIAEKMALGDGRVDDGALAAHVRAAARRLIAFDMARLARDTGSAISAVLFGALAASDVLPFSVQAFEDTVRAGGVGVAASLAAFHAARVAAAGAVDARDAERALASPGTRAGVPADARVRDLLRRVDAEFVEASRPLLTEGVRRLVDYQDPGYAALFLDRMARLARRPGGGDAVVQQEAARHLALWMSYEDVVRVAELKTRASRFARVHDEMRVAPGQLFDIHEFMHPRLQEICDTLPARMGRWLLASGTPRRLVERLTARGRVVGTTSLRGFLLLYLLSRLKRWRRASLRHATEDRRIVDWLEQTALAAAADPQLAVEVARCPRLVKGYGDTHARGVARFESVMAEVRRVGAGLAPVALRELVDAALADEQGVALGDALARRRVSA